MSMHYKLKSADDQQLVFKESNAIVWLSWLFPIIGFPILLLGLLGILASFPSNEPITAMDLILTGIGWTFTTAVGIMWTSRHSNPYQLIFDNDNGVVIIYQKRKGEDAITEIPYNEIDGFYIRTKTTSSSSSSGSSTSRNYIVYWLKKDGNMWDLCSYGNRSKAEAMQHKLVSQVKLDQSPNLSKQPKLPESITMKKSANGVALEWRNKITAKFLFFMLIILGFCTVDAGLYLKWMEEGDGMPFFVMTPFMALLVGLIIYYLIKNISTTYRLVITDTELFFEHIKGEQITKKKSIKLADIAAIMFEFKDVVGGSPLKILNHNEFNQLQEAMRGDFNFSDIGKLISMAYQSFQINIDALDVVDKVDLEKILQRVILEKGGVDVL